MAVYDNIKSITPIRGKSQITIPKEIIKIVNLKEGDQVQLTVEDGRIIITPVVVIPKDQAWFYTEEWQLKEKETDRDIKEGRLYEADDLDNLMDELEA